MGSFRINGGKNLKGVIYPQGAKNEALQILCATLLSDQTITIENIPDIKSFDKILNTGTVSKNYSPERYIFSLQRELDKIPKNKMIFGIKSIMDFFLKSFGRQLLQNFLKP